LMTDDVLGSALERLDAAIRDARWPQPSVVQGGARAHSPEQQTALMAREPAARKAIDAMCRAWVAGGELPALLDQTTHNLFYARLVEARSLGAWLRENGFSAPDVPVGPLLDLLLIEYWRSFVAAGWRASALGQRPA